MNYCPFCQLPLDNPVNQCPSCHADLSEHQQGRMRGGTLKESLGDMPAQFPMENIGTPAQSTEHLTQRAGSKKILPSKQNPQPQRGAFQLGFGLRGGAGEPSEDSALPFRPVNRPPILVLCALDDGSREEGEWFRLRKPEVRIGRTEGEPGRPNEIVIAHDNGISSIHAEISLRVEEGRQRYVLKDWPSRNGTFVRISRSALKNGQELLIGARRYSLDLPASEVGRSAAKTARLVEMTPRGNGQEFPLGEENHILGSDPSQCDIRIAGDPFVSSAHARIFQDKRNRWMIEDLHSLNGIWMRIEEAALETGGEFQIGEQRFLVRIP